MPRHRGDDTASEMSRGTDMSRGTASTARTGRSGRSAQASRPARREPIIGLPKVSRPRQPASVAKSVTSTAGSTSTANGGRRPWPFKARPGVCVRPFHIVDRDPDPRRRYFPPLPAHLRDRPSIAVCVPAYNEERHTLQRSLIGLALQQWELCLEFGDKAPILYVAIIIDGVDKAAPSMLSYLGDLVGFDRSFLDESPTTAHILCTPVEYRERELGVTLLTVEDARRIDAPNPVVEDHRVAILDKLHWKLPLFVTGFIKRANGRKHHSHEWFFNGMCSSIRSDLSFATDVGTLYSTGLLVQLYTYMLVHQRCAASCGHQKVMTWVDQTPPSEMKAGTEEEFTSGLLRQCQSFDFVSGQALFKGSHAMSGFLSVLPGPCGLYRFAYLNHPGPDGKTALDHYFEMVKKSPLESSIITANLKIAEDRILSYVAVLRAARPVIWRQSCFNMEKEVEDPTIHDYEWVRDCTTGYVGTAKFFFESEAPLSELVKQRRRWLNGTTAGYLWLFMEILATWPDRDHDALFNIVVTTNLSFQIAIFTSLAFFPAILLIAYQLSLDGLVQLIIAWNDPFLLVNEGIDMENAYINPEIFTGVHVVGGIFFAIYAIALIALAFISMRDAYNPWVWNLVLWTGVIIVQTQLIALFGAAVTFALNPIAREKFGTEIFGIWRNPTLAEDMEWYRFAALFGFFYISLPYIIAFLTSGWSELVAILPPAAVVYMSFSPTMVGGFFLYALSRISDLGWGTKEAAPAAETEMDMPSTDAGSSAGLRVVGEVREEDDEGAYESDPEYDSDAGSEARDRVARLPQSHVYGPETSGIHDDQPHHGRGGMPRPPPSPASSVGGNMSVLFEENTEQFRRLPRNLRERIAGGNKRRKARTQQEVDDAFKLVSMSAMERFRTIRYATILIVLLLNFAITLVMLIYKNRNPEYLVMTGVIGAAPGLWPFSRSFFYAVAYRPFQRIRDFFFPPVVYSCRETASGLPPVLLKMRQRRRGGAKAAFRTPPPAPVGKPASSAAASHH